MEVYHVCGQVPGTSALEPVVCLSNYRGGGGFLPQAAPVEENEYLTCVRTLESLTGPPGFAHKAFACLCVSGLTVPS